MSFVIFKVIAGPVTLNDLGKELVGAASSTFDFTDLEPNEIALSASTGGDLETAINAGDILVVDPRAGYSGNLNAANSLTAALAANDVHIGIQLANLGDLDNVNLTGEANTFVLQLNGGGVYVPVAPSVLAGSIALDDLSDVDDVTPHTLNTVYVYKGDGTNLDVVDFTTDADVTEAVQDIIGATFGNGTDTTFVYNDGAGTMQVNVNDVFLRNTGDILTAGTLTIASGASIAIAAGGDLTIVDPPVNPTDAVNKAYVDSVAAGLDPKESVRAGTTGVLTGVGLAYSAVGGAGGAGEFTNVDVTNIDGTAMVVGDRILVKDQADPLQNGIYVVTVAGALGTIERASDQDGSPAGEVSAGNFTFVEQGTTLIGTGWVVTGDGILTLNTDPIVWTQFSESSTFSAGDGLNLTGSVFSLDLNNLTAATITTADEIGFNDVSAANAQRNTTVANFLTDLNIPNGVTTNGIIVNNAGVYSTVSIAVDGVGALDGLNLVNANGTAGNPTIGLDITGLPVRSDAVDLNDRVAVYNVTTGANEYYLITDIANAGAASAFGSIIGDSGTAAADGPSDPVTFTGDGVFITGTPGASAAVDFRLDISDLTSIGAGTIALTDTLAIDDGTTANKEATFTDLVGDLQIPNAIGPGIGFVVSDGAGSYTTRTISASILEDELGLVVNANNGSVNLAVGLDIVGLTDPNADMAAVDEFAVHDKSEGTGGANRKITGQNIADGVSTILNLPTGLAVTAIGGQQVLTLIDTTRANKVLSVETTAVTWSENRIGNNDWVQIGNANDALIGYIVPLNATIVKVTAHTSNGNVTNAKNIDLYVDDVLKTASIATLPVGVGQQEDSDVTLNIDIVAGEKLQLRGASTGGTIQDTVITIWFKWRG